MTPLQIQILTALFTILGSGVLAALVNHLFINDRENRAAKRKCAEGLFLAVDGFSKVYSTYTFNIHCVMCGRITYDQAHDIIIKSGNSEKDKSHFTNIEMMVALYFPELDKELRGLLDLRSKINDIELEFKNKNSGLMHRGYADKYCLALQEFEAMEKRFKDRIAAVVKAI